MRRRAESSVDVWILRLLLALYPSRFREVFGEELLALYRRRRASVVQGNRPNLALPALAASTFKDTLVGVPLTWRDEWQRPGRIPGRRGEFWMKNLLREGLLTARVLFTRQLSFTSLCVVTLALGLGAATAIFSVVHGVLLAPLPYGDPDRIVLLYQSPPDQGFGQFGGPNFNELRERLKSFEVMAGYDDYRPQGVDLTGGEKVERASVLPVGSGYFEALGVAPILGRTFERHEEIPPDAHERDPNRFAMITKPPAPVVILSYRFWQRYFSGERDALGATLELEKAPYTVVGIMPERLGGHVGGAPDLWLPHDLAPGGLNVHGNQYMSVVARLREGTSLDQARAELDGATTWLRETFPRTNEGVHLHAEPLEEVVVGPSRSMLGLLFAAVGAMLAIACINVANLFLARGLGRRQELGLRVALGAGRKRLFASTLIESLWIGVAGGALGLGLAWLAVRWLHQLRPAALPRYDALGLHLPVVAFSVGAVLLTVLIFGLSPAFRAARVHVPGAFGDRSPASGSRRERRARDLGVSLQVALSLVLLTAGSLLGRSFLSLHQTDLGFDPDQALTFQLRLPEYAYDEPANRIAFYGDLFAELDRLPDLEAAGATSKLPGTGHRNHWGFRIEGRERAEGEPFTGAEIRCVAGRALEALAVPLLAGRGLRADDQPGAPRAVLVNQALVDTYFNGEQVLGTRLQVGGGDPRAIVGIVGDARHDPREAVVPKIYVPQPQFATSRNWDLSFVVSRPESSTTPWTSIREQVESVVASLDSRLVVYDVRPMAEVAAEPIARQRFGAQLMMIFAVMSIVLAAVGLFGAMAYSLGQRRAELGVRMALGADRGVVLGSVLFQGLRVFLLGAALGLGGVMVISRWLESVLYQVEPLDPTSLLFAFGVLLLVAVAAAFEPARRATQLDPAEILRES